MKFELWHSNTFEPLAASFLLTQTLCIKSFIVKPLSTFDLNALIQLHQYMNSRIPAEGNEKSVAEKDPFMCQIIFKNQHKYHLSKASEE